jgi:hypothetical protein
MKKLFVFVVFIFLFIPSIIFSQQEISKLRIGTFDSRCVAAAYGSSADFMKEIDVLRNDVAKAEEDGNEELAKELEQQSATVGGIIISGVAAQHFFRVKKNIR